MNNFDMPILRPVPIQTKGCGFFKRVWRWFSSRREWELIDDYSYLHKGVRLFIPKGFIFDGASIPRPFWWILEPTGLLLIPSIFHDYAYQHDYLWHMLPEGPAMWKRGAGKAFWDKLFLEIGEAVNGVHFANRVAWLSVTVGGWWAWQGHD